MRRAVSKLVPLVHYWPIVAIVLAWDAWVVLNNYTSSVAPRPWAALTDIAMNPLAYADHVAYTARMSLTGLAIGSTTAIVAGIAVWSSALVSGVITPTALVLRSVPLTAIIPIIAQVVGYGDATVLIITSIICFFPVFVLTISGLSSVAESGSDLFTVFGSSRWNRVWRLHLPTAVPSIMIALRISVPNAILGCMIAELLVGNQGLGYLFSESRSYAQMDRVWGAAVVASTLAIGAFLLARRLERVTVKRMT